MPSTRKRMVLAAALLCAATGIEARGQLRASETGSISQTIDGTKITITYARPRGRGRPNFFGVDTVVTWNEVWTPGANEATTLEVSKSIKLDGHPIEAGKYSLWMVVKKAGDWTFVLDAKADRWHTNRPDTNNAVVKFPVHLQKAPYLDVLTWSMPELRGDGGTLVMQWGTTKVAMKLDVEARYPLHIAESDAAPFLGSYAVTRTVRGNPVTSTMKLVMEHGAMRMLFEPKNPDLDKAYLLRMKGDLFTVGFADDNGELMFVSGPGMTYEFTRESGRAVRFESRGDNDKILSTGVRKPGS